MPRALWVTPVEEVGGVARHVLDAATAGIPGWDLTVAAPEGALLAALQDLGCRTIALQIGEDAPALLAAHQLRDLIHTERPDVIHSHLARADFLATAGAIGTGIPLVSTEHGIAANPRLYNARRFTAGVKHALHRARCRRFRAIIAVSHSTHDQVIHQWHPRCPVPVIPNGSDPLPQPPRPGAGMRFLTLSRLAPEKNVAAVLDAFAEVVRHHPEARLTVAGAGPLLAELQDRAHRLGIDGQVEFPGNVDASTALASHDVLVQLSAWENCSYTLLDAVRAGLGVVATPVGGNPEILPEACLTPATSAHAVSEIMMKQATQLELRPTLPSGWPTIADMTASIAEVYEEVSR